MTLRTTVSAVCKRMDEIIPFMDERDCGDFLEVTRKVNARAKKNKARLEAATAVSQKSLDELLSVSPPHFLREKKRQADDKEKEEDAVSGEVITPWDSTAHAYIKRVVNTEGDDVIVEAKRSSHGKIKCSLARVTPDQISMIDQRHWAVMALYFFDHPMPVAISKTPFGQYSAEQAGFLRDPSP